MKCKYCGKDLVEGAKFCVYCGKPVEEEKIDLPIEEPIQESEIPSIEGLKPVDVNVTEENEVKVEQAPIDQNVEVNVEPTPIELPKEEPESIVEPAPVQQEEAPQPTVENTTKVVVKRNNPILLIIIILILLAILGLGGFYIYKNYIEKDNKSSNNNTDITETTDTTAEKEYDKVKAKELVDKYYYTTTSPDLNLFTTELTSNQQKGIAIKNLPQSKIQTITCEGLSDFSKDSDSTCRKKDDNSVITQGKMIEYSNLDGEYKYLFGKDKSVEKKDFEVVLTTWKYNSDKDAFIDYNKLGGYAVSPYFTTYGVQNARVQDENLIIDIGYIFVWSKTSDDQQKFVAKIGGEELTFTTAEVQKDTFEKEFTDKYLDKLDTYEFTFKYEDDHYVFVDMKKK